MAGQRADTTAQVLASERLRHSAPSTLHFVGQATPRDAFFSFAWACDHSDVDALANLVWFDGNGRETASAVLASMPEEIRREYPTPEKFYALVLAAETLLAPSPGLDELQQATPYELGPGRFEMRRPGKGPRTGQRYQQTPEGWKFVIPAKVVAEMPLVLNSPTLLKLARR